MAKIISIHQPNYLPWLGYFHKMTYSDVFVFLDSAQYSKQTFINRCIISNAGKMIRLIIPVSMERWDVTIRDVTIRPNKFARKHLESLRYAYGKCPHYENVIAVIKPSYEIETTNLADFNMNLIQALARFLGIRTQFVRLSELDLDSTKNQLLIDIAKVCGGDIYVSGIGAKTYIEGFESQYEEAGLSLSYQNFVHPNYSQQNKPFVKGCSILDLLFNHGPKAYEILSRQHESPYTEWNGCNV